MATTIGLGSTSPREALAADQRQRDGLPAALRLSQASVRHHGKIVLHVPDLTIEASEVVTLLGPNGAGKSTLLRIGALLHRPDAGEVWLAGNLATRQTTRVLRRQVTLVFQEPLLFDRTVLDNAASGLHFHGVRPREARLRAMTWLERFGVDHLSTRSAKSLSGGEAQRVCLARAFALEPALLLLDEPFAALDPPTRADLLPELAARLKETGTAAILVTHDPLEAMALGDRVGVMLSGQIAQLGPPEELLANPATPEIGRFVRISTVLYDRIVNRGRAGMPSEQELV